MIFEHKSVLLYETVDSLNIQPDGIYVDGTLGGGGHAYEVLKRLGPKGRLIGIDQDADAIQAASGRLKEYGENGFNAGDYIVKPDSTDRYQIGASASLQGVYNINKGYAVFKQIDVLASNDEYYTIKKNMTYGLAVYDHIVLDASTVSEGELIYQ